MFPHLFFWRGLNYVSGESALPPRKSFPSHEDLCRISKKSSIIIASVVTWAEKVLVYGIRIDAVHYVRTLYANTCWNHQPDVTRKMEQSFQLYRLTYSTMAKEKRRGAESRTTALLHEFSSSSRGSPSAQVTHTLLGRGERGAMRRRSSSFFRKPHGKRRKRGERESSKHGRKKRKKKEGGTMRPGGGG